MFFLLSYIGLVYIPSIFPLPFPPLSLSLTIRNLQTSSKKARKISIPSPVFSHIPYNASSWSRNLGHSLRRRRQRPENSLRNTGRRRPSEKRRHPRRIRRRRRSAAGLPAGIVLAIEGRRVRLVRPERVLRAQRINQRHRLEFEPTRQPKSQLHFSAVFR